MTKISSLKAPTTYAEWSACLEVFESGGEDESALAAMSAGTLSWTGGVAPLFARRISDTLGTRLRRIADDMSRGLRLGGDATMLSRVMLDARQKLALLHRLITLPVFAEELRTGLEQQLTQYAETAQRSLEESARQDRSGQLAGTIRQCSLLQFKNVALSAVTASVSAAPARTSTAIEPGSGGSSGSGRRRNILV